jgi:FtsZ-binding cell division protein ZapB
MTNLSIARRVLVMTALLWPVSIAAQQETAKSSRAPQEQQRGRLTPAERANLPRPQGFSVVLVLGEMQGTGAAENVPPAARKALVDMKDFLPYKSYRLLDSQWTLCCGQSTIATRLRGVDDQDYELELDPRGSEISGKWNVRFSLREAVLAVGRGGVPSTNAATVDRAAHLAAQRAELETKLKSLKERYNDNHPEVQQVKQQIDTLARQASMVRAEDNLKRYRMTTMAGRHRALIETNFTMDIGETVVVGTSRLQGDKALIALLTAVASIKPATATR